LSRSNVTQKRPLVSTNCILIGDLLMKQVVEYQGIPVGVLVPADNLLTFLAVKFDVIDLDGKRFSSAAEAREAVRVHVTKREPLAA
jgi:hypothetical protein